MVDWVAGAYSRYADKLFRYALMILADQDEAADAVHGVFTRLLVSRPIAHELEHYLRRATRNACVSRLRRRNREASPERPILEAAASPDDPELRVAVERALRTLSPEQREVIHLKVYEGFTFQEIASLTTESINTIASRYRYAIERLRAQL